MYYDIQLFQINVDCYFDLQSKSYAGGGYNGNNYAARPIICLPSYIFENKREFPKVGDTVHYSPIGNYNYNYNADYATSYKIDSSEYYMINNMFGEAITEWKVMKYVMNYIQIQVKR